MKNNYIYILVIIIALLSCTKQNSLDDEFKIGRLLTNCSVILENKAMVAECDEKTFAKIKDELTKNGFENWYTFNGILGVDNVMILKFVNRKLLYSVKTLNGKKVIKGIYSPTVVYDKDKKKIYFVMATDLGG